jgi:Protein of unknown function (DUF3592)
VKRKAISLVFGLPMILFGGQYVFGFCGELLGLSMMNDWKPTVGTVTLSDVDRRFGNMFGRYTINLDYEYQFNGNTYQGQPIALERRFFYTYQSALRAMPSRASKINLKVNPINPRQSCWRCAFELAGFNGAALFLIACLTSVGGWIIWQGFRNRLRNA